MAPQSTETEAVVLNCIDHGESDAIVTLLCQNSGRISAIAKGARKSKKRFVNKLELFSFLHVSYQQKPGWGLAFLSEADLHTSFINIRLQPALYAVASVIREFLLISIKDGEADNKIFTLCLWAFHSLNQNQQPRAILTLFLIQFFDYIGYRPDFEMCHKCNTPYSTTHTYRFDASSGGITCSTCDKSGKYNLSHGTIKILQVAQNQPLEKLQRLKISGAILEETLQLLHNYGRQLFQRDIASWKIFQQLTHTGYQHNRR
jgi:DNA repair protein RecO (recombination protein O)